MVRPPVVGTPVIEQLERVGLVPVGNVPIGKIVFRSHAKVLLLGSAAPAGAGTPTRRTVAEQGGGGNALRAMIRPLRDRRALE
jgi:hypothetical protein